MDCAHSRVPIHLVYMNTYVADSGKLVVKPDIYGYDAHVQSALKGRYLVVKERSQRGSAVVRSARVSRSAARHSSSARVAQEPVRTGWQEPPTAFGVFWGWNSGY
jgi:hypothetical protein